MFACFSDRDIENQAMSNLKKIGQQIDQGAFKLSDTFDQVFQLISQDLQDIFSNIVQEINIDSDSHSNSHLDTNSDSRLDTNSDTELDAMDESESEENDLIDIERNKYSHIGEIASIVPLTQFVPEEYIGKCYHCIKMVDGCTFQLIFDDFNFSEIESHLKVGYQIKITYEMPNYQVSNIFPRPYCVVLEDQELENELAHKLDQNLNKSAKVYYMEDEIQKIVFI